MGEPPEPRERDDAAPEGERSSGREPAPVSRRRRGLRERISGLRDYGPGSGTFDSLLRGGGGDGLRERIGGGGERVSSRWREIPEIARQRILAGAILVAVAALVWFVLLPLGPCGLPGGDSCAPEDDAIEMIPADALAYAHISLDPDDEQFERLASIAGRAPGLSSLALGEVASGPLDGVDLDAIRDWAGEEAAIATLPIGADSQHAALIAVDDDAAAQIFAAGLVGPNASTESLAGVTIRVARKGGEGALSSAFFAGFAVLGEREAVKAIVSRWTEQAPALSADPAAEAAIAALPERHAGYAYLSPAGTQELLHGDLGALEPFVNPASTAGVGIGLAAEDERLELSVRSVLDPALEGDSPGLFAALAPFDPTLTADVGTRALGYAGLGDPAASVDSLTSQAEEMVSRLPQGLERAARDLRKGTGIDLVGEIVPLLGSQAALSVQPVGGAEEAPGVVGSAGAPYATLLASGVDSRRAARTLAELQEPFAEAVGGDAPPERFETIQVAGVSAQALPVSPAIDLTYATWDDRLAIATDPLGIEQARGEGPGLEESPAFEAATSGMPEQVAILAYLNVGEILVLAEQVGFATDPAYAALAPELRVLRAGALWVTAGGGQIATDLSVPTAED